MKQVKNELESISSLRIKADEIIRLSDEISNISKEIIQIESDLQYSGLTKTLTQAQEEQDNINTKWYFINSMHF